MCPPQSFLTFARSPLTCMPFFCLLFKAQAIILRTPFFQNQQMILRMCHMKADASWEYSLFQEWSSDKGSKTVLK